MDETTEKVTPNDSEEVKPDVPESPKPMAFIVNFDEGKVVDTQRYKNLFEKYQSRHKRGQSLSKFDESPTTVQPKKHPLTGKLPHTEESSTDDDFERSISKNKKDLTTTRYNRAFSLRRARLDVETPAPKCPNTPEMRRKFAPNDKERTVSVDRKSGKTPDVQSRYMNISKSSKNVPNKNEITTPKPTPKLMTNKPPVFSRTDTGRFSMRTPKPNSAPRPLKKEQSKKQSGPRSNSTLSSREVEFQNWKRRKSYDPMKAAAEGKRKAELARKQNQNVMTQSYNESQDCDSSPSHSSSVHRSQSFHGTAALEQLLSSDEDITLSGEDEGFSPPTPSPCELSPSRSNLRHIWMDRFSSKR